MWPVKVSILRFCFPFSVRPDPSAVYCHFLGITYFSRSCRPCIQMCSCICSHVCHTENQSMFLHFYKVSPYTSPLSKIRTAQVNENQEELVISFSLRVLYVVAEGKLHSLSLLTFAEFSGKSSFARAFEFLSTKFFTRSLVLARSWFARVGYFCSQKIITTTTTTTKSRQKKVNNNNK